MARFGAEATPAPANALADWRKQLHEAIPSLSDEDLDKAVKVHAGVAPKPGVEKPDVDETWTPDGQPYAGPGGAMVQNFKNKAGEIQARPVPAGTPTKTPPQSTAQQELMIRSWFPKGATAAQREWGIKHYQHLLHPDTSSTHETIQYNTLTGEPIIVPLHTQASKGWGPDGPPPPNADGSSPIEAPATPAALKSTAATVKKTAGTAPQAARPDPRLAGLQHTPPGYAPAKKDYDEAVALSSLADQVALHPNDAVNQKSLAVALEKARAGRFTQQAVEYIIKAGWGNTIDQWANNPSTGALPSDVMRQLVDGAHQNLQAKKDALAAAGGGGGGANPPSTGGNPNAIKINRDANGRIIGIE
jgi:hypothetical protein